MKRRHEVNIYDASGEICVIGEATVRLGTRLVEELEEKIDTMKRIRPEMVKPKMIKVVYTDYAVPSALQLAKDHGVWVLNWKGSLTPMKITVT